VASRTEGLNPGLAYELDPQASIRHEQFGGLAYHHGNRRLSFLRDPVLADLVRDLGRYPSLEEALAARGMPPGRQEALCQGLASLVRSGMIRKSGPDTPQPGSGDGGPPPPAPGAASRALAGRLSAGLSAPICLTWELTYACNLACIHCLSSSGRRDPRELTAEQARGLIDDLANLSVFYVNIGGGEPTVRADFYDLVAYAVERGVGVKFSTNGSTLTRRRADQLATMTYVDVQVSIDGATPATNDPVRGPGSFAAARRAMDHLAEAGVQPFKVSVVVTRHNVAQLDQLEALAAAYGAQLRLTRLRPAGRGAATWHRLHPTPDQQRHLYSWLRERPQVLTGDSFFHLSALGPALSGLNLCGAGRVVCLVDPVGDVYACPFTLHPEFRAGSVLDPGGLAEVWRSSELFAGLRRPASPGACSSCGSYDACRGGCLAAKFFTGLPLDGPDPECVQGHGEKALARVPPGQAPSPGLGHSRLPAVPLPLPARR
jgi:mycofactocin radical SAM maturase